MKKISVLVFGILFCFSFQLKAQYSEYSFSFQGESIRYELKVNKEDSNMLDLPLAEKIKTVEFNVPLIGTKNIGVKSYDIVLLRGGLDPIEYSVIGTRFTDKAIEELNSGRVTSIILRNIKASYLLNGDIISLAPVSIRIE